MYIVRYTNAFQKNVKKCKQQGYNIDLLTEVIGLLRTTGTLPAKYRAHKLNAQYHFCWECHIQPDWLLLWDQNDVELTLLFTGTGTHADIFG